MTHVFASVCSRVAFGYDATCLQAQLNAQTDRPLTSCFSFMDDVTMAVPIMAARLAEHVAEAAMAAVGLPLCMS